MVEKGTTSSVEESSYFRRPGVQRVLSPYEMADHVRTGGLRVERIYVRVGMQTRMNGDLKKVLGSVIGCVVKLRDVTG